MNSALTALSILIISTSSFGYSYSYCGNDQIIIQAIVTDELSQKAYEDYDAPAEFGKKDLVQVFEIKNKTTVYLTEGTLSDDGAGNYEISATSAKGPKITFLHDHETWHTDGLYGSYTSSTGETIDLETIKCEQDELFLFR